MGLIFKSNNFSCINFNLKYKFLANLINIRPVAIAVALGTLNDDDYIRHIKYELFLGRLLWVQGASKQIFSLETQHGFVSFIVSVRESKSCDRFCAVSAGLDEASADNLR